MNDKERLDNFVRASQYIARITADQDFFAEVAGLLGCYFGASWTVFAKCTTDGAVETVFDNLREESLRDAVQAESFRQRMASVMETGFMDYVAGGPFTALLLPLSVHGMLAVGYPAGADLPKETMNLLLGVAGLVETVLERLESEQALRENRDQLDALVRERTEELHEKNQLLVGEVHERLATEAILRESEERFKALFMRAPIAIYVHDAETFALLDANPCACDSYGYDSVEELKSADFWLDPPYSFADARRWMEKAVREGSQLYERCSRDKAGELFWEQLQLVKIELSGKPRVLIMASDITDRKRTETVLRESEERLRALAENLPLGMVMMDQERRVIHANPIMRKWFPDADFDSAPTCYCSMHNPPLNEASDECPVARTLATGENHSGERTTFIGGEERQLSMFSAPIRDANGHVIAAMEVLEDITERKRAEAEMERLNEQMRDAMRIEAHQAGKIETATGILHDIGNAISGMGAVFVDYREGDAWSETGRLKRLLAMMRASQDRFDEVLGESKGATLCAYMEKMIAMLNDRADRQRAATDRAEAIVSHISSILAMQRRYALSGAVGARNPVCLGELMDDALNMMSASLQKRRIHVNRRYTSSDGRVSGDQTALIQVFVNLLKNVCEAFDQDDLPKQRNVRIDMTARPSDNHCQVVLTDNACGFSAEAKVRLFERAYTTKPQGSGIGLPFVQGVMQSHGGRIQMESPGIGLGAHIQLDFPLTTQQREVPNEHE